MHGKLMGGQGQPSAGQFLCAADGFSAEQPAGELLEDPQNRNNRQRDKRGDRPRADDLMASLAQGWRS